MDLTTRVETLSKGFKMFTSRLEKLGIVTVENLLYHIPSRYEDYSLISKIEAVQPGEKVTIIGKVLEMKNEFTSKWKKLQKAKLQDETGIIDVIWFNQQFLTQVIHMGDTVALSGRVGVFMHKAVMESPDYEVLALESGKHYEAIHTGRLVPIYPETRGVSSKWLRRQIHKILQEHPNLFEEFLPEKIKQKENLMDVSSAIKQIHFPNSIENANRAKYRLSFDELFLLQLAAQQRRAQWKEKIHGHVLQIEKLQSKIEAFIQSLPFELTSAQQRATDAIFQDLQSDKPMNRLLEGDVGSGKTVVSAIAMYVAHLNGYQSVLMAPTEILATQHFNTIKTFLEPFGLKVGLQTGSTKSIESRIKKKELGNKEEKNLNSQFIIHNSFDILVGTHAVLSKQVNFDHLGLVVIDEQQRFGVAQRGIIREKGENPHLLTMTATPIPRTVALTMYGELDVSYLDELPKGRKIIKTWLVPTEKREGAYEWIKKQIRETDSQIFIICPFIEESESMTTVKAAAKEFERLQKDVFQEFILGLLHGKLKAKEKNDVLDKFKQKEFDILVATPVVEVGIDIQNATVIVIEASDRFGLAQLHQLRGRVGRGDKQSYCLLFTESVNEQTKLRLKAMETSHIGSELAELDLKLRGPGDMFGTQQHGVKRLKVANFYDFALIEKARNTAKQRFPTLNEYPILKEKVAKMTEGIISPD